MERKLSDLEKLTGRSPNYYSKTPWEQWDKDKALGILDWDGSIQWLLEHNIIQCKNKIAYEFRNDSNNA